jgi:5,10-methylenetetrahydrofolate reductase
MKVRKMKEIKQFKEILKEKRIPITYEIYSPRGYKVNQFIASLSSFKDKLDAITVPDNPLATLKISPISYAHLIKKSLKIDVIPHLTCRDRNILALQSEILGAHLLGIRNLFVTTGDRTAEFREKRKVNSIRLCKIIKLMNGGLSYSGEKFESNERTDFLVGGAVIFGRKSETSILAKKIEAGFDFFLSQIIYSPDKVINFFNQIEAQGFELSQPILFGLSPISSRKMLENILRMPSFKISTELVEKLRESANIAETSLELCLEVAKQLKKELASKYKIGFHLMPFGNDQFGRVIIKELR